MSLNTEPATPERPTIRDIHQKMSRILLAGAQAAPETPSPLLSPGVRVLRGLVHDAFYLDLALADGTICEMTDHGVYRPTYNPQSETARSNLAQGNHPLAISITAPGQALTRYFSTIPGALENHTIGWSRWAGEGPIMPGAEDLTVVINQPVLVRSDLGPLNDTALEQTAAPLLQIYLS